MTYIWLTRAYLLAYDEGLDIVAAETPSISLGQQWPNGRFLGKIVFSIWLSGEASDAEVDIIENYGDVVEALLLLGANSNVELDANIVDDNYIDYVYGEDDDTPEYKELHDGEVDVNAEV